MLLIITLMDCKKPETKDQYMSREIVGAWTYKNKGFNSNSTGPVLLFKDDTMFTFLKNELLTKQAYRIENDYLLLTDIMFEEVVDTLPLRIGHDSIRICNRNVYKRGPKNFKGNGYELTLEKEFKGFSFHQILSREERDSLFMLYRQMDGEIDSIVIPAYNGDRFIREADSLFVRNFHLKVGKGEKERRFTFMLGPEFDTLNSWYEVNFVEKSSFLSHEHISKIIIEREIQYPNIQGIDDQTSVAMKAHLYLKDDAVGVLESLPRNLMIALVVDGKIINTHFRNKNGIFSVNLSGNYKLGNWSEARELF